MALTTVPVEARGPFFVGDIPESVTMTVRRPADQGGGPVDLSAFDTFGVWMRHDDGAWTDKTATVLDAQGGVLKYTPVSGDFDLKGQYDFLFYFASGTNTKLTAAKVVRLHFVGKEDVL